MSIEEILEYEFTNRALLEEALTHPSRGKSKLKGTFNYQRLEFVGDAVLGLVVAEMLFELFPKASEGELARRHAALVRSETIALVGSELKIEPYIQMAASEEMSGGRSNKSNIEDVMEALLGAVYLDGGLEPAAQLIRTHWLPHASSHSTPPLDAKTELQEWAQARGLPLPNYKVTQEEGPSHAPVFTIEVSVKGHKPTTASGPSKRQAEQKAARQLLEVLGT